MHHPEASVLARLRDQHFSLVVLIAVALLFGSVALGQQLTGTLSGTAYDPAGAVVPNAKVEIVNEASGDVRRTVSGSMGTFSMSAVPPGSYTVNIVAPGFAQWQAKGIFLNIGDNRTLNATLKVGVTKDEIEVVGSGESVAVMDSGEVSATLNTQMVDQIAITGRDAGELMKIMPGMGKNTGQQAGGQGAFGDAAVGSNAGPVGQYSSNGTQPFGSMAFMWEGANLVDSGNVGTQIANINADMTAEIKVLMSSYGAEYAKGPVIFQAFSKSGGKAFHGEGYLYARNSMFNAEDSYLKNQGVAQPDTHYYYPGGNIGGPILIPFTRFNHNRNRLFFWFGYEYMDQHPAGSLQEYFVPTPQMIGGNFSPSYLSSLKQPGGWSNGFNVPCSDSTLWNYSGGCSTSNINGGMVPKSSMDPNGLAYLSLYPASNIDGATHNGYNYEFINNSPQNRWEQSEKIDYAVSDFTKLSVSYTYQLEHDSHPIATWWAPSQAVPYPSAMPADTPSKVLAANFTHVFSPTLVNEAVFTIGSYTNGLTLAKPAAVNPSSLGMTYKGLFGVNEKQMADILSWSSGLADFYPQATFYGPFTSGEFGATKSDYAAYDNVSKVIGTHTLKFGFYWNREGNLQSSTGLEGSWDVETYGNTSTNNTITDLLVGHASYSQQNTVPLANDRFNQISGYIQDSWKASKRLTLNLGIRLDHLGQYYDPGGKGAVVFMPSLYVAPANGAAPPFDDGLTWCAINKSIPCSGWKSPFVYPAPRVSAAYDVFGNARTVLRGGFAIFRYEYGTAPSSDTYSTSNGSFNWGSGNVGAQITSFAQINSLVTPSVGGNVDGGTIYSLDPKDNKMPMVMDWNFTISQAAPWRSVVEFSYVGNKSTDLVTIGSNSKVNDPNAVQPGALFKPDPVTGAVNCIRGVSCSGGLNLQDYFAYPVYQDIYFGEHTSYANYNSFQASWTKNTGPVLLFMNYAFGKVLGDRDGASFNGAGSGAQVDPFVQSNNYGVLAYDHTHIFNAAYVIHLPKPIHDNPILKQIVNGWELSGTTQLQSGSPLQPNTGGNLNVQWGNNVSNQIYLGTNAITLEPKITCDPRSGLASHQYFNPSCFAPPAPGTNGDIIWPYIHAPAYFNSDLSIYKTFKISESKSVQLRLEAFNFLNHPNGQFGLQGNSDQTLSFSASGTGALAQTNQNKSTTGSPAFTTGYRFVELAVKFYF